MKFRIILLMVALSAMLISCAGGTETNGVIEGEGQHRPYHTGTAVHAGTDPARGLCRTQGAGIRQRTQ
jgi:hypothetical protein